MDQASKIAELNDLLRCHHIGGNVMITQGIQALAPDTIMEIVAAVATFSDFTPDNDPHHFSAATAAQRDVPPTYHGPARASTQKEREGNVWFCPTSVVVHFWCNQSAEFGRFPMLYRNIGEH